MPHAAIVGVRVAVLARLAVAQLHGAREARVAVVGKAKHGRGGAVAAGAGARDGEEAAAGAGHARVQNPPRGVVRGVLEGQPVMKAQRTTRE